MQRYIMAISPRTEFLLVIITVFGYFILGSILTLFFPAPEAPIAENHLQFLLAYEPMVLFLMGGFLLMRGWRIQHIGLRAAMMDVPVGILLVMLSYMAYAILLILAAAIMPSLVAGSQALVTPDLSLGSVLLVSIVNPLFEEIFVCGYIISALGKKRGLILAVNVSVAIRLAYHLYQGAIGVAGIVPIGIIFAYWYALTGRLWPVIIAHGILDFVALAPYVGQ